MFSFHVFLPCETTPWEMLPLHEVEKVDLRRGVQTVGIHSASMTRTLAVSRSCRSAWGQVGVG